MVEVMEISSLESASAIVRKRIADLREIFIDSYGACPDFFVRAPGRVNLIGEHIDYCGYSVLPMALEQDMLFAVRHCLTERTLSMRNVNSNYPTFSFSIDDIRDMSPHYSTSDNKQDVSWCNYVLAGVRGVLLDKQMSQSEEVPLDVFSGGIQILVDGRVSACSGLSSDSALTCAAAISAAHCAHLVITRQHIAGLCARYETFVGTQGGGMDQAICLLARAGCARRIFFEPLIVRSVQLPSTACFLVANSLVKANKAATCSYNSRVLECRLAVQVLAKKQGVDWRVCNKLRHLQDILQKSLEQMVALVHSHLSQDIYTIDEVCGILETDRDHLHDASFTKNTQHIDTFKLKQRALHVFEEAWRVEKFEDECNRASVEAVDDIRGDCMSQSAVLGHLGAIMSESHRSCRDLYECSHPQLDRLCEIAENIAYGARLTGAGWGGCIVALVDINRSQQLLELLHKSYYHGLNEELCQMADISEYAFITRPADGAAIYN